MFFLLRSVVCIGLVVSALPTMPGLDIGARALDRRITQAGLPAATQLGRYCLTTPAHCSAATRIAADALLTIEPGGARSWPMLPPRSAQTQGRVASARGLL